MRAPLVAFLDSDDELMPNHLSLLSEELWSGGYDFLLASFEIVLCNGDPDPTVIDFYKWRGRVRIELTKPGIARPSWF